MFLVLGVATLLLQSAAGTESSQAARIHLWFDLALTADDEKQEAAIARELENEFAHRGLPTIQAVGDEAAYQFVFLACSPEHMPAPDRVLQAARRGARKKEIPRDAASYCEAHLRLEAARVRAKRVAPANSALRERIERLYVADQAVRQKDGFDAEKTVRTDREIEPELREIFATFGAPTYRMVGPDAASHFVVMIQHQSPAFRRKVLPKLKANVSAGQADPGSYAMMLDRSLSDEGKPQVYGENLVCDSRNPTLHTGPIEDPDHVNQRRAAIGLMRLNLYAALVVKMSPDVCSAPDGPKD